MSTTIHGDADIILQVCNTVAFVRGGGGKNTPPKFWRGWPPCTLSAASFDYIRNRFIDANNRLHRHHHHHFFNKTVVKTQPQTQRFKRNSWLLERERKETLSALETAVVSIRAYTPVCWPIAGVSWSRADCAARNSVWDLRAVCSLLSCSVL